MSRRIRRGVPTINEPEKLPIEIPAPPVTTEEPVLSSSTEELIVETCIAPTSEGRCKNPIVRFKFCDKHIAHCRLLYKRYKKSCQKASAFPDYYLGDLATQSEEELRSLEKKLRTKYASLNQCIQKRQAFEAECVYQGCHDEAHNYYYGTFPPMRQRCEEDLNTLTEEFSRRERVKREEEERLEKERKESLIRANREEYTGEKGQKKRQKKLTLKERKSRQIEQKQRETLALAEANQIRAKELAVIILDRANVMTKFVKEIAIFNDLDADGNPGINVETFLATFIKMNPHMETEAKWLLDNFDKIYGMTSDEAHELYRDKLIPLSQEELERYLDPFIYRITSPEGLKFFAKHTIDWDYIDEEMHKKYIATDDSPEKRALVDDIITMINEEFGLSEQVYVPPKSEKYSDVFDDAQQFYRVISGLTDNHIDAVISIFTINKWAKLVRAGLPTGRIILRTYYTKQQLLRLQEEFILTFQDDDDDMEDDDDVSIEGGSREGRDSGRDSGGRAQKDPKFQRGRL